jgi:hypothetical protein
MNHEHTADTARDFVAEIEDREIEDQLTRIAELFEMSYEELVAAIVSRS